MKPASFRYVRPRSIDEAIGALSGADAKIIAGGQSLVPMMNFRLVQPELLVDVNAIAELSGITETDRGLRFGALVRHSEAMASELVARHFPIIPEAMRHVAHLAIRNRGTIGGSLAHADPSAEWPLLVALLDGEIELRGPSGTRSLKSDAFLMAPLVTALQENEILTGIHLPKAERGAGMAFDEMAQRHGDFAVVAAGAVLAIEGGTIRNARLALGGVGLTAIRVPASEALLHGKAATAETFRQAADLATEGLQPNNDFHASAEYRKHLVPVMLRRVLETAAARVGGGGR